MPLLAGWIEVHGNEGGVTKYVGGWRWFIIPAGTAHALIDACSDIYNNNCWTYFVCLILFKNFGQGTSEGAFGVQSSLKWVAIDGEVWLRRYPSLIGYTDFLALLSQPNYGDSQPWIPRSRCCVHLGWVSFYEPFLQYLTLFYGVLFIGSFSIYYIYDDLITRTVEGSDAHACHKLIPCCMPRCVGVQFGLVALAFQGLGLYLALVWTSTWFEPVVKYLVPIQGFPCDDYIWIKPVSDVIHHARRPHEHHLFVQFVTINALA